MIVPSTSDLIEKWSYVSDKGDRVISVDNGDIAAIISVSKLERASSTCKNLNDIEDYLKAIAVVITKHTRETRDSSYLIPGLKEEDL